MGNKRVLVAMSGGIDSSITAILLLEQGYELEGVTFRTWDYISTGCWERETGCCSIDAIYKAKQLAEKLGFPHHILDFRDDFKNTVIKDFTDEYVAGRTPNPCVICNSHIKWGKLLEKADELDCGFIATGHYAKLRYENNRYIISSSHDATKDQSYVLYRLSQDNLKRTLFPLGEFCKSDIRKIAHEKGFDDLVNKRESYNICFIPDDDYHGFLEKQIPDFKTRFTEGDIITTDGKVLGKHKGYPFYTIGQRKGLDVAVGEPLYVKEIHADTNTIIVGKREELFGREMLVRDYNPVKYVTIPEHINITTRVRYHDEGTLSKLVVDGDTIKVSFDKGVFAITPGQSAVFYEGNDVVGGGIIS